jgi:putative ABC transport system permease protein
LLNTRERYRALAINGVADAIPVVIGFADWRMPSGAMTPVFVIGSDLRAGGLQPWDLVEGRIEALASAKAVAVDRTYFDRLGYLRDRRDRRKSGSNRYRWRPSPTVSGHSPRRRSFSWTSSAHGLYTGCRPGKATFSSFA